MYGIFTHLRADKVACYGFSKAGRRQKTPGSETKIIQPSQQGMYEFPFISKSQAVTQKSVIDGVSGHVMGIQNDSGTLGIWNLTFYDE